MADRWTVAHALVGVAYGAAGLDAAEALILAVLWEVVENPMKDRLPALFPEAQHDAPANVAGDVAGARDLVGNSRPLALVWVV